MTTTITADLDLDQVDLLDPALFADGPPHALFARMRTEMPVRWNRLPAGDGFWSLTRHEHISAVSKDPDTFSSWRAGIFMNPDQVLPLDLARNLLLYKDPPEHTKYRTILQRRFSPRVIAELEPAIRSAVTRAIDSVIDTGACDFVPDIATPVPLAVLVELMGLPTTDMPYLLEFTHKLEDAQRSPEPGAAMNLFVELGGYLNEQIAAQTSRDEQDSIVMRLRRGEVDGEALTDPEILLFFGLLIFAGNDTTRNTASAGIHALLEHPEQLDQMRENSALIPDAVEEMLRYTTVVNYFARTATRNTEIAGQPIAEGDKILMWYTSASRDEAIFDDPDRFDIHRGASDHKAFGGGGRHFCIGNSLARLTLRALFEQLLERTATIEPAGGVRRARSAWSNSLTSLPIHFTASTP